MPNRWPAFHKPNRRTRYQPGKGIWWLNSGTAAPTPAFTIDFTGGTLDSLVTFSRGSTGTRTNASGALESIGSGLPRFDYDPVTHELMGALREPQRINILLNSLLNGTNLSTQTVTVTAVQYVLSFYGTGSITLSGTASATVTGTGAYPSRKTLAFTPTAGSLTLTVSGTVQYAQLEAITTSATATSFIPTAGSAVTRSADSFLLNGTALTTAIGATEGTVLWEVQQQDTASLFPFCIDSNATNNRILADNGPMTVIASGVTQAATGINRNALRAKTAHRYKINDFNTARNGILVGTPDTSGTLPTGLLSARLGSVAIPSEGIGWLRKLTYYTQALSDSYLQSLSLLDVLLFAEGDSRTDGTTYVETNYSFPSTVHGDIAPLALTGSTLADVIARRPAEIARVRAGTKFIYTCLIGANDMGTYTGVDNATKAANYWADLQAHFNTLEAAGIRVVPITELPVDGDTVHNAVRAIVNPLMKTWASSHWGYVDFAADAIMGPDNSRTTNPTYWNDTKHPSTIGQTYLGTVFTTQFNALLPTLTA